jgi:hypothetical protein
MRKCIFLKFLNLVGMELHNQKKGYPFQIEGYIIQCIGKSIMIIEGLRNNIQTINF